MTLTWAVELALAAAVATGLTIHLWRQRAPAWQRLLWTPVVWLPVFGWVFYGGWFRVPAEQEEGEQATFEAD